MNVKTDEEKWGLHRKRLEYLFFWGLKKGYISTYDDALIKKLRTIYYGGLPASVLLLCRGMSNGHCYDRALLLSRAFLDLEDDIKLIYASINSLRLNPEYIDKDDPLYADHCIVERVTKDDHHIIYDTSSGLMYDKNLYWKMEHPKVRKINGKKSIIEYINKDEDYYPEDIERDKYASTITIPIIEMNYKNKNELYAAKGIELLQREVEHYKKVIDYESVEKEVDEDMIRLGLKK